MAYTKTNWVNGTTPLNDKNMNKIENALENLDTNISKSTDEYSSTSTYSIGELVIYNNKLYKANQDITTAEAFNSSHWTEVTLLSDVNEIKSVVNNNANYSTKEQRIGTWIDGKPIYRKVISHTITGNTTEHEPHNISNVERAISIRFSLINQYGIFQTSDPTINVNMDTSQISISSEWATGLMYVILEYTKTTD